MVSKARLNIVLIEIEGVLNGRPLTYLNDEEYCDSLTLNHLAHGRGIFNRTTTNLMKSVIEMIVVKLCKVIKSLNKHFKKRYVNEHFTAL